MKRGAEEETKEMIIKKSELIEIRKSLAVCSCCGSVFCRVCSETAVCESCVKKAMEAEGFRYEKG